MSTVSIYDIKYRKEMGEFEEIIVIDLGKFADLSIKLTTDCWDHDKFKSFTNNVQNRVNAEFPVVIEDGGINDCWIYKSRTNMLSMTS